MKHIDNNILDNDFDRATDNPDFIQEIDLGMNKQENSEDESLVVMYEMQKNLQNMTQNHDEQYKKNHNEHVYFKKHKKSLFVGAIFGIIFALFVFVISIIAGGAWSRYNIYSKYGTLTASTDTKALPDELFLKKMYQINKLIDGNYIFDYKKSHMQDFILKGMVASLDDPYSQYYTADEFKSAIEQFDGRYTGIGAIVEVLKDEKAIRIRAVYPKSPAQKAGIQDGDIIKKIDGKVINLGMSSEEVVSLIKGEKGTVVNLLVIRGNDKKGKNIKVIRDNIQLPTVKEDIFEKNIGYIRIFEFNMNTTKEFHDAYKNIIKKGAKKVIIDVRDNPGGSFKTICDILDGFLSDGVIVYTEDKNKKREYVKADEYVEYELPMVVLMNENSASASEIFCSTVKDRKLGKLIGEKTFGKGIVQNTIPLSDGTAIKLTISKYYTASGNEIHKKGITPDIKITYKQPKFIENKKYTYKDDNQIMRAIKELK